MEFVKKLGINSPFVLKPQQNRQPDPAEIRLDEEGINEREQQKITEDPNEIKLQAEPEVDNDGWEEVKAVTVQKDPAELDLDCF